MRFRPITLRDFLLVCDKIHYCISTHNSELQWLWLSPDLLALLHAHVSLSSIICVLIDPQPLLVQLITTQYTAGDDDVEAFSSYVQFWRIFESVAWNENIIKESNRDTDSLTAAARHSAHENFINEWTEHNKLEMHYTATTQFPLHNNNTVSTTQQFPLAVTT